MQMIMDSSVTGERFIISGVNTSYRNIYTLIANGFKKRPPHKKVTAFLAAIVWRVEAIKAMFTGKDPLLTKETAKTARAKVTFNNSKLLNRFPEFRYTPLETSIQRICKEFKKKMELIDN
jgi:hypothetical protein